MKTGPWLLAILVVIYSLACQVGLATGNPVSDTNSDALGHKPSNYVENDKSASNDGGSGSFRNEPDDIIPKTDPHSLHYLVIEKPSNLTITAVTNTTITLQWTQKNPQVFAYTITYRALNKPKPAGDVRQVEFQTGDSSPGTSFSHESEAMLHFNLTKLEPSTEYAISVTAFHARGKASSHEIIVVTADPRKLGPNELPGINITSISCIDEQNLDVGWKTVNGESNNFYYYVEYIKKYDTHGQWSHSAVQAMIHSRLNNSTTRLTLPKFEGPALYKISVCIGFAYDNTSKVLTGKVLASIQCSVSESVVIQANCTALQPPMSSPKDEDYTTTTEQITTTVHLLTTTKQNIDFPATVTVRLTSPPSTNNVGGGGGAGGPSATTPSIISPFEPPEKKDVKANDSGGGGGGGDGNVFKIVPGSAEGDSAGSSNGSSGSSSGSADKPLSENTFVWISVLISITCIIVLIVLILWRAHSKQCRLACAYGGNYYVDDPPRLPLLGSHNNGNIGWDGDGVGNNTPIPPPPTTQGGGLGGKNSNSSTNVTMTSTTTATDDQSGTAAAVTAQQQQQQQQLQLKESIPIHLFPKHVTELHADGDIGFSKEYEVIQTASLQNEQFTSEFSHHPENKLKNRYLNIVAYDHTLVRVESSGSSGSSGGCGLGSMSNGLTGGGSNKKWTNGYINGNYIDGFQQPYGYIGTQGPLPSTFETFWNVVWEHKVTTIVMITNLIERGRKKCDMYWPRELGASEIYGFVSVKFTKEQIMATYTLRTFVIHNLKIKKKNRKKLMGKFGSSYRDSSSATSTERIVYHYHYTHWPDHGTPSHTLPVLSFVKKSSHSNAMTNGGPIIVHCSAGVGRTGTYIVLDAMLKQIHARGDVNVFGFLRHIRSQRNFLVQTEEQYIFIHDALLEAIQSADTNVEQNSIAAYVNTLLTSTCVDENGSITLLDYHFKLITNFQPKEFQTAASLRPCNLNKIRNKDYICTDAYRVPLTAKAGVEGSEYINASFLPGYEKLREFILCQHPLETTITSFWQMISDHNVQHVVVLSSVDDDEFPVFWPTRENEELELDTFRVKLLEESDRVGYVLRDLSIQSLADDDELNIKMIQSSDWPHHCVSIQQSIFQLIDVVMESVRDTPPCPTPQGLGPIVIVDKYGGKEGATFCALTTVVKQMEFESTVDVYMYAKLYHEQRPGVWKTPEDYLYMYRCLAELTTGEALLKNTEQGISCSSSPASTSASSATSPPSPVTEPVVSASNTPLHTNQYYCQNNGKEQLKDSSNRDEMVVVVQIDNHLDENDQIKLTKASSSTTTAKPESPSSSSNSSVVLSMSPYKQNSPGDMHTCEHLMSPLQPVRLNTTPSPTATIEQLEIQRKTPPDLVINPICARTISPLVVLETQKEVPAVVNMSTPLVPTPSPTKDKKEVVRTTTPPVSQTISPSKPHILFARTSPEPALTNKAAAAQSQPFTFDNQKRQTGTGGNRPTSTHSPTKPLEGVTTIPVSTPPLNKTPSPTTKIPASAIGSLQTTSPVLGVPLSSSKAQTPSPTTSNKGTSPILLPTPSPPLLLQTEQQQSLSSIPTTPSPPPPPLPSSPPPPGSLLLPEQGQCWDQAVGVMGSNNDVDPVSTITPPPPPQLLDSPTHLPPPVASIDKSPSPTNKSLNATKNDNNGNGNSDEGTNLMLPPPPLLPSASEDETEQTQKKTESVELKTVAVQQNGKKEPQQQQHESSSLSPAAGGGDITNGNGLRSVLLEEIKEEDEGAGEGEQRAVCVGGGMKAKGQQHQQQQHRHEGENGSTAANNHTMSHEGGNGH